LRHSVEVLALAAAVRSYSIYILFVELLSLLSFFTPLHFDKLGYRANNQLLSALFNKKVRICGVFVIWPRRQNVKTYWNTAEESDLVWGDFNESETRSGRNNVSRQHSDAGQHCVSQSPPFESRTSFTLPLRA